MGDVPLFGPFSRKGSYSRVTVLDDFNADNRFMRLHQETMQLAEIDELTFYRRYLNRNDRVLVYGTFDPGLFNTLSEEGYDLYLVEPEASRLNGISSRFMHKVYGLSYDLIDAVGYEAFEKLILPGTTVARYSRGELLLFFRNIRQLLTTDGQLLVNVHNAKHLKQQTQPIASKRVKDCALFYGQKVEGERLILNLYLKSDQDEKVSYAVEHLYEPITLFEFAKLSKYAGRTLYAGKTVHILEFDKLG